MGALDRLVSRGTGNVTIINGSVFGGALPKGSSIEQTVNGRTTLAFEAFQIHLAPAGDRFRVSISERGESLGDHFVRASQGRVEWTDDSGSPLGHELAEIPAEVRSAVERHLLKQSAREEPLTGPTSNAPLSADTGDFIKALKRQSFDSGRLETVKAWCSSAGAITSSDLAKIMKAFSFDSGRTDALRLLAPKVSEWSAGDAILKAFSFDSGKDQARKIVTGQG